MLPSFSRLRQEYMIPYVTEKAFEVSWIGWGRNMGLFSRDRTPGLRKWTAKHYETDIKSTDEKDPDSLGTALAASILKSVAGVFLTKNKQPQSTAGAETQDVFNNAAKYFDTDLVLFEVLCYVLCHLDAWVFSNANRSFREDFFNGKVIQKCLEVFSAIIGSNSVFPAFNNRVDVYGRLFRDHKGAGGDLFEREIYYLTQFIFRSTWKEKLEVYDVDQNPVIIRGAFDAFTIQMHVAAYVIAILPAQIDAVKYVMARLHEFGQFAE